MCRRVKRNDLMHGWLKKVGVVLMCVIGLGQLEVVKNGEYVANFLRIGTVYDIVTSPYFQTPLTLYYSYTTLKKTIRKHQYI